MSKMSKAIAVLGVVAGLGVAALPLSSYAANSQTKGAQIQVAVEGGISLTLKADATDNKYDATSRLLDLGTIKLGGTPATGVIVANVATNNDKGYELKLSAAETVMTSGEGYTIPTGAVNAGDSYWGYKLADATSYSSLTTAGDTIKQQTGPSAANGDDIPVTFGVSVSNAQQEGTYTGNVIFTATVKE